MIWIRVRDVRAEYARLAAAGFPVVREPAAEPWGLIEMQIEDPSASGSSWSRFPPVTLAPGPAISSTAKVTNRAACATDGLSAP